MIKVFLNGFSTGFLLQFALGPVFFFVLDTALRRTMSDGFTAVAGVAVGDYFYIFLAACGVGVLLKNTKIHTISAFLGALILVIFGSYTALHALFDPVPSAVVNSVMPDNCSSFISAFALTVSNPLTIVFWTGLFTSKAFEHGYTRNSLAIFGFSAGLATPVFLAAAVLCIEMLKGSVSPAITEDLHVLVGAVLAGYGILRVATFCGKGIGHSTGERQG
ncbi:MAG: LysE family transporter [Chlorobiaceae bacterium]|jgi:threonine/homoserine/homoserine lactone efflux protein|nr:LysE family transporter [Chlorobiaceae bacterium]